MTFDNDKKECLSKLYKPDRSKKGTVDKAIISLIDKINKQDNYYTTSSCAGRIVIISLSEANKKNEAEWLFTNHDPITFEQIQPTLNNLPETKVWFKQESAIFHIACRTLDDAMILVSKAKSVGFKRSGVMTVLPERFMVEICGTENIETIISQKGQLLCDEEYIKQLINEANIKLNRTREKINKFYDLI